MALKSVNFVSLWMCEVNINRRLKASSVFAGERGRSPRQGWPRSVQEWPLVLTIPRFYSINLFLNMNQNYQLICMTWWLFTVHKRWKQPLKVNLTPYKRKWQKQTLLVSDECVAWTQINIILITKTKCKILSMLF